jgi:hypothetical protein
MTARVRLVVLEPAQEGPPTLRELTTVELARVPGAYEGLELGGELYRITCVRHVVGGEVAAIVQVELLPVLPAEAAR